MSRFLGRKGIPLRRGQEKILWGKRHPKRTDKKSDSVQSARHRYNTKKLTDIGGE